MHFCSESKSDTFSSTLIFYFFFKKGRQHLSEFSKHFGCFRVFSSSVFILEEFKLKKPMGYFQLTDNPDLAARVALKSSRVFLSSSLSEDGHVLMQHLKRSMPLVFLGSQTPILSSFMP